MPPTPSLAAICSWARANAVEASLGNVDSIIDADMGSGSVVSVGKSSSTVVIFVVPAGGLVCRWERGGEDMVGYGKGRNLEGGSHDEGPEITIFYCTIVGKANISHNTIEVGQMISFSSY